MLMFLLLMFFPFTSTYASMNRAKFHGNRSVPFPEIRNADRQTQTDRRGNFI